MFRHIFVVLLLITVLERSVWNYEDEISHSGTEMKVSVEDEGIESGLFRYNYFVYVCYSKLVEEANLISKYQVVIMIIINLWYWNMVRKLRNILPETRMWADEIERDDYYSEVTNNLALRAHIKHVWTFKTYIATELFVILILLFSFNKIVCMLDQSVILFRYAEYVTENFTVPSTPDVIFLRDKLSDLQSFSAKFCFLSLCAIVTSNITLINIILNFMRYLQQKFSAMLPVLIINVVGNNGNDNGIVEENIILDYFEYLMMNYVMKTGDLRLVQHVGLNILANRRRILEQAD